MGFARALDSYGTQSQARRGIAKFSSAVCLPSIAFIHLAKTKLTMPTGV
jgi:hypothetical protein